MYKLYNKMIENTSWVHHFICKILLLIIYPVLIDSTILSFIILEKISILIYFVWNKEVRLEDFVELSIFNSGIIGKFRALSWKLAKLTYT